MCDEQNVLALGANGQLGRALKFVFPDATFYNRNDCDLSDTESLSQLDLSEFDVVINAAAFTAVDAAETEEGSVLSHTINADAVSQLARKCEASGCVLVHISSDYVFDGLKEGPYLESDEFSPVSVYGRTKALGDMAVSQIGRHYLIRTSWVIGDGNNFVRTMVSLADKGINPSVVEDQIGRPTFAEDLASAIAHLLATHAPFGTYNVTCDGPATNWAEIARIVFQSVGRNPEDVISVSTEEYFMGKTNVAKRPKNSLLNLGKIESTGFVPQDWLNRLYEYLAHYAGE